MRKRLFAMLSAFVFLLSGIIACAEDEWEDWGEDDWGDEDSWGEDDWDDDDWGDDTDEADFDDEEEDKVKTGNAMMDSLSGYDDDFEVEGDFRYVFSEDRSSCTTKRYIGNEKDVLVPETLGGVPVTAIGDQTFQDCKIESVVLPETLISIDNMAFFKCEKLREVSVPEGVTNLGRCCFAGCITLQRISMPTTLETVDEFAFLNCILLTEVSFGENLKEIGPNAFNRCEALQKVILPDDVEIDETAFTLCSENLVTEFTNS